MNNQNKEYLNQCIIPRQKWFFHVFFNFRRSKVLAIQTISILFQVYMLMLFARILGSWVPELSQSRFMHFISFYTDPYLNLFKKIIPPIGMIDFSPIVAFIVLNVLEKAVVSLTIMMLR